MLFHNDALYKSTFYLLTYLLTAYWLYTRHTHTHAHIDNRIYNSRLNSPHQLHRRKCPQSSCYWAEE